MKINTKSILKAVGLMGAGALLAMVETARELTVSKHAEENRKAMRILMDGYESNTLNVEGAGFGKVKVSAMYKADEVPDYVK